MAKKNRKCVCCGETYSYCPTCGSQDKLKPTWSSQFCSQDCQELWATATKFNLDMISKPEAKAAIEKLELKEKSAYVECVQRDLENILAEDVQPVVEPIAVEETAPVLEEETPSPKKKQKSHAVVTKEYK